MVMNKYKINVNIFICLSNTDFKLKYYKTTVRLNADEALQRLHITVTNVSFGECAKKSKELKLNRFGLIDKFVC
jgi:hypothetical protein